MTKVIICEIDFDYTFSNKTTLERFWEKVDKKSDLVLLLEGKLGDTYDN